MASHLNIGHRHILPTKGPLLIFAGSAAWWFNAFLRPFVIGRLLAAATLLSAITTIVLRWPLASLHRFFQLAQWRAVHRLEKLVDSSLDWGQDLPGLRQWIEAQRQKEPQTPIYVSYFGTGDLKHYQINAIPLPGFIDRRSPAAVVPLEPGVYCLSASMLQVFTPNSRGMDR